VVDRELSGRLSSEPQRRRVLELVWCAILAIIAVAVFGDGLSRHLHSDDWVLQRWTRPDGLATAGRWLSLEVARTWGVRPTLLGAATAIGLLGEGRPQHVASLLLHLTTAILLFLVVRGEAAGDPAARRRIDRLWPAAVASLVFLLHPAHDEAVYWFSALAYPLAGTLGLSYWLLSDSPRPASRAVSWLVLGAALLAHPTAAVFPLARLVRPAGGSRARVSATLGSLLAVALAVLGVALGSATAGSAAHPALGELPGNAARLAAGAVWPLGPPAASMVLLLALVGLAAASALRGDRVAPAALVVLLGSAAASALAFPGLQSPRYLYLPALGAAMALGALFSRNAPGKLVALGLSVFLLARGAGANAGRAIAWNAAGALGDRVFDSLLPALPASGAVLLAGEPGDLDGAWVLRHGLAERLAGRRSGLAVTDLRQRLAPLLDAGTVAGKQALLFDGKGWIDVSAARRGSCLALLRPDERPDGFVGSWRTTVRLEPGPKRLLVWARGEGALGEPALLEVRFAGQPAGSHRTTERIDVYEQSCVATGGEDVLEIRIANDLYDPARGLDRNLWVELAVVTCP